MANAARTRERTACRRCVARCLARAGCVLQLLLPLLLLLLRLRLLLCVEGRHGLGAVLDRLCVGVSRAVAAPNRLLLLRGRRALRGRGVHRVSVLPLLGRLGGILPLRRLRGILPLRRLGGILPLRRLRGILRLLLWRWCRRGLLLLVHRLCRLVLLLLLLIDGLRCRIASGLLSDSV